MLITRIATFLVLISQSCEINGWNTANFWELLRLREIWISASKAALSHCYTHEQHVCQNQHMCQNQQVCHNQHVQGPVYAKIETRQHVSE